jgi:hypothetical protein
VLSIYVLVVVPDQTPIWLRTVAGVIGAALGGAFGFFRGKVTPIRTGGTTGHDLRRSVIGGVSTLGGCIWTALLGSADLASTADSRGANGCADPISACLLRRDVLDAVPEV